MTVDKVDKAGLSLKQKKAEVERAKEDVSRGGKECQGMEKELADIHKRREKVSDNDASSRSYRRKWSKEARYKD